MRRIASFVLLGLGVFAVAVGLLLRFYAYPQLAKAPVDIETSVEAEGSGVTALKYVKHDGVTLPEIQTGLSVTATRAVKGDVTQPEVTEGGDVMSWIEVVEVKEKGTTDPISVTERQLCLDRHTNVAVEPCTNQWVKAKTGSDFLPITEKNVFQPGQSLKFPFATEKRSYDVYDLNLRKSAEAKFDGEEEIDGLAVYRFVQDIPATKLESKKVPGSLIGSSESAVDADLFYQNRRTMWVEPVTGQIVKGQEVQRQELRESGDSTGTAVLDGTLTFTDKAVADNIAYAKDNKQKLWLLTTFPIYLWIGGAVLAGLGVVMVLRTRGGRTVHRGGSRRRELADTAV